MGVINKKFTLYKKDKQKIIGKKNSDLILHFENDLKTAEAGGGG